MFFRLLFESFRRQKRRKSIALLAIALGMTVATAMLAVGNDIGDRMNQELRSLSANLILTPADDTLDVKIGNVDLKPASEGAFIRESELPQLKGIFWGHNILGFAPFLNDTRTVSAHGQGFPAQIIGTYFAQPLQYGTERFITGVRSVNSWWKVEGTWPPDYPDWPAGSAPEVLIGSRLAQSAQLARGDQIEIAGRRLQVSGILSAGTGEEDAVVAPLHIVQALLGQPDRVRRVSVSALTKPEDAFARRDPDKMSPAMRDRWYCSPYAKSIAYQIHEALPGVHVEQVRQVEQNEGRVLSRISGLMLLLALASLVAAGLAVSAAMAATILARQNEVGLMKSLGASNAAIAVLFLTEAGFLAVAGGLIGFAGGALLAHRMGTLIFGTSISVHPIVLPIVLCTALLVTFVASVASVRRAVRFDPALVLRGAV